MSTLPKAAAFNANRNRDASASYTPMLTTASDLKSLKRCLLVSVRFGSELLSYLSSSAGSAEFSVAKSPLAGALFPLLTDAVGEELIDVVSLALHELMSNKQRYDSLVYKRALSLLVDIIQNVGTYQKEYFGEKIYCELLYFIELMLEDEQGRVAIHEFLNAPNSQSPRAPGKESYDLESAVVATCANFDLTAMLLGVAGSSPAGSDYSARVIGFFRRLFDLALEEGSTNQSGGLHAALRKYVVSLGEQEPERIQKWIEFLVLGMYRCYYYRSLAIYSVYR